MLKLFKRTGEKIMTIYQLKKKVDAWKKFNKNRSNTTYYWDEVVVMGLDDIASDEEHYIKLLKKAEQAANAIIKEDEKRR